MEGDALTRRDPRCYECNIADFDSVYVGLNGSQRVNMRFELKSLKGIKEKDTPIQKSPVSPSH